ncbi:MAG: type III pantothenate kinase [Dehalococcoidia bacterium]|tara:strand:+ start:634 stop:1398 length:765 start_codon:yes stop_codon:yes gene_type:complete
MFLAVDIGNTSVKIGLYTSSDFNSIWRIETNETRSQILDFESIEAWLLKNKVVPQEIESIGLASVVPNLTEMITNSLKNHFKTNLLVIDSDLDLGIKLKVDKPKEVGIDRIINAVSASEILPTPIIIIDFGTATTFDVVDKNGDYIGGTIVPGVELSSRALASNTAKLPEIPLEFPSKWIGKNTVESMQSGLMNGYMGLVEGMVNGINTELGQNANVIATGGLAATISKRTNCIGIVKPSLTLDGIKRIWELNN